MKIFLGRLVARLVVFPKAPRSGCRSEFKFFIGSVLACPMPNADVIVQFCFINRSSKVLTARFVAKEVLIETLLLHAGRRDFDIKSNRRRTLTLIHPLL